MNRRISIDNDMLLRLKTELDGALLQAARAVDDKSTVTIACNIQLKAKETEEKHITGDRLKLLSPVEFAIKITTKRDIDKASGAICDVLLQADDNTGEVFAYNADQQLTIFELAEEE